MLPPGYLFRPTDEILLVAYLKNKLLQWPLPCDVIVEGDVYGSRPQDLALEYPMANKDYEWFFFTSNPRKRSGARETSRASRRAGLGRWKATKGVKKVLDSESTTIGSKQSFCYMEQNWDGGEDKSIWLMEEFSMQNLEGRGSAGVIRDTNKLDDWVICKIYLTPKARKAHADLKQFASPTLEPAAKRRRIEPEYTMVPPGFIFQPTDEELLDFFLQEKLLHQPLPCDIIKEADVYGNHPSNLTAQMAMANGNSEWFFFTWTTRKHPNAEASTRASRVAGQGRWKSTQSVKPVLNSEGQVIGSKQNFSYMERTPLGKEEKSIWLMEEYSIQNLRRCGGAAMMMDRNKLDDWVVCKIYLRPSARKELCATEVPTMESRELEVQEIWYQPFVLPIEDSMISRPAGNTLLQITEGLDQEVEFCSCKSHDSSLQYPSPDELQKNFESPPADKILQQFADAPDKNSNVLQLPTPDELKKIYLRPSARKELCGTEVSTMKNRELEVQEIWYQPFVLPIQQIIEGLDQEVEFCSCKSHDSLLQYPSPDELQENFESLPADKILQQFADAPDTNSDVLQLPTLDELKKIFESPLADEILQQFADAPDEGVGVEQHDMTSFSPPCST